MPSIRVVITALIAVLAVVVPSATGQVRVVSWNLAELRGEPADIQTVIEMLDDDDHGSAAVPATLLVCQEIDNATYLALIGDPPGTGLLGPDWSTATYTNQNEDNYGGAQACFYRAAVVQEVQTEHDDLYTGAGRHADRWKFQLVGHTDPIVEFYVYSAHLKAGNNSSAEDEREVGALRIIQDLAKLPSDTAAIVVGDMNFYDSNELGYLAYLIGGLFDPLGTGSWSGGSNAIKHSQSPRKIASGGLASGGLDDRFDFHLHTSVMETSGGLGVISESYRSVGNDGNHYDDAINDGTNTYLSNQSASTLLANALHEASDHLPVLADYRLPAVLEASIASCEVGTVIEGWEGDCELSVTNGAGASNAAGAAQLDWSVAGTGVLAGNTSQGNLSAGNGVTIPIDVDTTQSGVFADTLNVSASGTWTQHSESAFQIEGHVLRHANPSFVYDADNNFYVYFVYFERDSGVQPLAVSFWNYQWDTDQSRMDVDSVSMPDAPVSFLGGVWSGVGPFPISLPFEIDTTGLAAGTYVRPVSIVVSDEDVPGESTSQLNLTFNITITDPQPDCIGDVNGDGVTDIGDLLDFLAGYGGTDPALDLNGDGMVDVTDLLALLADFGC